MNLLPPDPKSRRRLVVLIASLLFMLIGSGSIYFIVVALKVISTEFAWPRAVPSIAYALQYGMAGVGGIFMGWCLDRRGPAIPVLIGAAMMGLGAIATAYVTSPWELYLIYGIMLGFLGRSTLFTPLTANITRWYEHNRSLAVGVVGSGQGLAGMIWPQVFHYLIASYGWRTAAMLYGFFALATLLPLAIILRHSPPVTELPTSSATAGGSASKRPVLSPLAIQLTLSIAAIGCCVGMSLPLAHIVSHISDLGFDPARGAEILSVMLGCSTLASLFGVGWLGKRYGGLRAIVAFSSGQATLLFALAFVDTLPTLYIAAALFGLGYGGILPCYPLIVRELLPASEAGRRTGLVLLCAGGGMALGSWMGGYVFDLTGSYSNAFLIGVGFNLGNLLLITSLIWRTRIARPSYA